MKKVIIFIIFIINIISAFIPSAYAFNSTPSADIKQKLKSLQDEIASKAAKLKLEVGKKLQNKVYTGYIKTISDTSLTIATAKNTKIININDYTQYIGKTVKQSRSSFKNLIEDNYIAALGDIDETEILTAKKIIKLNPPQDRAKEVVFGTVISMDDQILAIQTKDNPKITLSTDENTTFQLGKNDINLNDVKQNNTVIAVGIRSKSNILKTRFVYIVPSGIALKTKTATSPGSLKTKPSTPTATIKSKK